MKVSVSILDCDFLRLEQELRLVTAAGADSIHLDVMDGRFVANLSYGAPIGRAVRRAVTLPIHTHLMVVEPERLIPQFLPFSDLITIHVEATASPGDCIRLIRQQGKDSGITLNPDTPVETLAPFVALVQDVLVMSVFPGQGGQKLIPESFRRIAGLRALIASRGSAATISVDGGVDTTNCRELARAGVDTLIAGNAVFHSRDYAAAIQELKCSSS